MNISAKIISHSYGQARDIITYEITLPKVLLAEFNTHRVLSRNFSSSRAIPTEKVVMGDYFEPLFYGKNQPGMVAYNELISDIGEAELLWKTAVDYNRKVSLELHHLGLHKQWSNRCNDWHAMAKGVVTGTDWDNFFALRDHEDAQPEIRELARVMKAELTASVPYLIGAGEWHLPYIDRVRHAETGELLYFVASEPSGHAAFYCLSDAIRISISCCAQVSYRKSDDSLEKANRIYDMLNIGSLDKPSHLSPLEHQATPIFSSCGLTNQPFASNTWEPGITHVTRSGKLMSGNFSEFIQYRQLI
jgi:hypothetical protein